MVGRLGWALVLGLTVAKAATYGAEALEERVRAVLETPGYQHAHWGVLVVEADSGRTIYEHEPDALCIPASVTKLFTTAAALVDLGADFRFRTPVVRLGEVEEGTLRGDLVLVASGDLSLGGRTGPEGRLLFEDEDHSYAGGNLTSRRVAGADPLAGLDALARGVREAGIAAVTGDVLVDDRLFERAPSSGSGPSWVSPIVINDNLVDVQVTPGSRPGDPATVVMIPETDFVTMDARVETVAEGEEPSVRVQVVGPRRFRVRGRLPVGHDPVLKIYEVEEPAAFARALFIERLRARGVRVDASPLGFNHADRLPPRKAVRDRPRVAEYVSPPFSESARIILKVSQNLHASTLPLLIAARHGESSLSAGLKREGAILEHLGVDVRTISLGGGAGGTRSDLVTPRATVALLRALSDRPVGELFEEALPVLGRDGTLAKAVNPDSPARGHARAKTGTYWVDNPLNGTSVLTSKALAGYLETASGRHLVFAFFLNGVPIDRPESKIPEATKAAGRLLGRLCEAFYADQED